LPCKSGHKKEDPHLLASDYSSRPLKKEKGKKKKGQANLLALLHDHALRKGKKGEEGREGWACNLQTPGERLGFSSGLAKKGGSGRSIGMDARRGGRDLGTSGLFGAGNDNLTKFIWAPKEKGEESPRPSAAARLEGNCSYLLDPRRERTGPLFVRARVSI